MSPWPDVGGIVLGSYKGVLQGTTQLTLGGTFHLCREPDVYPP